MPLMCVKDLPLLFAYWASVKAASLQITLKVPEVVGTENRVTYNLPFLLDPSSITKRQS